VAVVNAATTGVGSDPGSGSPNRLLHSLFEGGGGGGGGSTPNQPPTASFTYSCTDLACAFNGSGSSDSDGTISSYHWAFGDGSTGSGMNPSRTYSGGGTYTVTLTVTDNVGATGSQSQSVTMTAPPLPSATVVHVGALSASTSRSGPNWRVVVTTTIRDAGGNAVGGATVSASWSTGGTGSCTTGSDGTCQIQSAMLKSNVSSTTFTVTGVSGSNMTYDAGANTPTALTVARP
jgi:PKD repeat protein